MELLNTKKTFKVGEETLEVKKCSVLDLARIRQNVIDTIKTSWKKDMAEVVIALPEKERTNFMLKALSIQTPSDEQISQYMMGINGIVAVVSVVLDKTEKEIQLLIQKDAEVVYNIFEFSMDVENKEEEQEEDKKDKNKKK